MGISDKIEAFILELMKQEQQPLKIQRNELAEVFGCVPSQINYVISTRFCPEKGYLVTSRRGGGGYVVIQRVEHSREIENEITEQEAFYYIRMLYDTSKITLREAKLMQKAVSDMALYRIQNKDSVRADILKSMLGLVKEEL